MFMGQLGDYVRYVVKDRNLEFILGYKNMQVIYLSFFKQLIIVIILIIYEFESQIKIFIMWFLKII